MEEGDENFDWRLSFGEFKRLLSQSFEPSVKGEVWARLVHLDVEEWSEELLAPALML